MSLVYSFSAGSREGSCLKVVGTSYSAYGGGKTKMSLVCSFFAGSRGAMPQNS
ncbi:MAG: hypothetical protein LBR79_04010 [Oscillospiraceae bacterium]|nr:hypothetical protein [Oscillospiraceae bacterium]